MYICSLRTGSTSTNHRFLPDGRMVYTVLWLALFVLLGGCLNRNAMPDMTGANTGPYLTSYENLDRVRDLMEEGEGIYPELKEHLVFVADTILASERTYSVTFQTGQPHSPTGSSHDYVSLARYAWPDPGTPGVYTMLDSRTNPEIYLYDRGELGSLARVTHTLALAWYMTRNEAYAERMTELVRIWFLEELTRMRPHFRHAQFWPGVNSGGPQGIIEATDFITILEAVSIAGKSASWTTEDHIRLQEWVWEFQQWVVKNYNREAFIQSNVGTWIDAQKAVYALFTEQEHLLESGNYLMPLEDRIDWQISPDGKQPSEMSRWRSMDYTYFNLKAWLTLIEIRANMQKIPELSTMQASRSLMSPSIRGASVLGALEWFYPFASGENDWSIAGFQQLDAFDRCQLIDVYRPAALRLRRPGYEALVRELLDNPACRTNTTLLTHPPLTIHDGS